MKKINIAKLIKDCPSGMELDCTMYEDVYFDYVDELNIIHCYIQHGTYKTSITFNQFGTPNSNLKSKCVIFPKGKTTWEGFQISYTNGDIVYTIGGGIVILGDRVGKHSESFNSCCGLFSFGFDTAVLVSPKRFATEEEKKKLFDAIKENGYKWNTETKTLEKLPKFKVGDRITNGKTSITIGYIDNEYYYEIGRNIANRLFIKNQDEWNLVSNKFDINTLKPFESRVLVRDSNRKWRPAVYGFCDKFEKRCAFYTVGGGVFEQCIPYEGNEDLLGTNNDCNKYFKIWE